MIRILLVNPEYPATYWSFKHSLSFVNKKALLPPLGLLTVAAMLTDEYEPSLVDMNTSPLTDDDILRADLALVTGMIVQKDSFLEVGERCNRLHTPIVAGGPYPTSLYETIPGVDHFIIGEAEESFPRFLRDYGAGRCQKIYRSESRPDITRPPVPRFDLVDMDLYNCISLQFSRGCPHHCEFCDIVHLFGNIPRTKTPEQFLREMEAAARTGFRGSLFIVDDNFIGNRGKVKELLRAMIPWQEEHGYPFEIITEASIDLAADDELLSLMVKAGFTTTFIGIETPVQESLSETGKTLNQRADIMESVRKIQEAGIEVTGGFIIGFDSDPPSIFDRQIEFIQDLAIPTAMIGLLMALPNTGLYNRLLRAGRIRNDSDGNNTHAVKLNFIPRMDETALYEGYRRVLKSVYAPRTYFNRAYELITRFPASRAKPVYRANRPLTFTEIRAFFRSLFRQGFSSYGIHYLWFMFRVFLFHTGLIPFATLMAIQGNHFFRITSEMTSGGNQGRKLAKERKMSTIGIDPQRITEQGA